MITLRKIMMRRYSLDLNDMVPVEDIIKGAIIAFFMEKGIAPHEVLFKVYSQEDIYELMDADPTFKARFSEHVTSYNADITDLKFVIFLCCGPKKNKVTHALPIFFCDFLDETVAFGFTLNSTRKAMLQWHKNRYCKEKNNARS